MPKQKKGYCGFKQLLLLHYQGVSNRKIADDVILTDPAVVGKRYLAKALGQQVWLDKFSILRSNYLRIPCDAKVCEDGLEP